MIGQWFKCIKTSTSEHFMEGEWYECIGDINEKGAFRDEKGEPNGFCLPNDRFGNHNHFDLTQSRRMIFVDFSETPRGHRRGVEL